MSGALTVIQATNSVISSAESVVSIYQRTRSLRKQDMLKLQEETRVAVRLCRSRGYGMLVQANLEELHSAVQALDQYQFGPEYLPFAMAQIQTLAQLLQRNLIEYCGPYV